MDIMVNLSSSDVTEDGTNAHVLSSGHESSASAPSSNAAPSSNYRIRCPYLPLAVYREIEAHLRQINGVDAGLLPQSHQDFDYLASQIGGLWIAYQASPNFMVQQRVEAVLKHYSDRFGAWEVI
ncbi:MAG: hypothetical protein AAF327_15205 [Cyanobacteria bacterium P01_A01_bin.37]